MSSIFYSHQITLGYSNQGGDKRSMWHIQERKYKVLIRKPERKRPLGNPRLKWENNTRMDLKAQ
jgi:hypothetical protein